MANIIPPTMALLADEAGPPLAPNTPPVIAPAHIEFQGSSFPLHLINRQSKELNNVPQMAKLPPITGDFCLIASTDPNILSP